MKDEDFIKMLEDLKIKHFHDWADWDSVINEIKLEFLKRSL